MCDKSKSSSSSKVWRAQAACPDEELVISGMAGRFPESDNVDELAHNLYNKVSFFFVKKNVPCAEYPESQ